MRIYKSYELTTMCQLRKHNPNYDFENDEVKMFEMKSSSQDEPPEHLAGDRAKSPKRYYVVDSKSWFYSTGKNVKIVLPL